MQKSLNTNMDFLLYEKGENFLLNGIAQRGLFVEATEKILQYDDIILTSKISLETGSLVNYQKSIWLIISQVDLSDDADSKIFRARIRKANYNAKFNFLGNVKSFDAIISTQILDIENGKFMSMSVGKILVSLSDTLDSRDIIIDQRFLIMGQAWKVVGIDKSSVGLIILNCDMVVFNTNDDKVNEIADRWTYEVTHKYTLSIVGETASVNVNGVLTVTANVLDNSVAMVNPSITYLSSDSNIVSVDNTGKVMAISLGIATITAQLTNNPSIKDTIVITVLEVPTSHNYSITIIGSSTVKLGQTQVYTATFYDNGVPVTDQSGTWLLTKTDGSVPATTYGSITTQTGVSASVKGASTNYTYGNFLLVCTLMGNSSIKASKQIKLESLI